MSSTRISCHINAPRAVVYRALLDPRAVAKWKVPDGMTCHVHAFDAREGGSFRISLTYDAPTAAGKTTEHTDTYHGRFVNLVPNEKVVEVDEFETEDPALRGEMTITITLADGDGGTDLLAVHDGLPRAVSPADNETGWRMALAKLAALVETGSNIRFDKEMAVSKLRVESFSMSIDGFSAGPNQSLENPLGVGGLALHEWAFPTATFQRMFGNEAGTTGIDNDFAARGFSNIGAWIMGRNMFGPIRGPWPDGNWKGWWGDNPPYHMPVFVLTHHAREPITMEGGTTFHFITDGIYTALDRAKEAANGLDVRLGGGVATIQQYLRASLIDELHIAIAPILLGSGEKLFSDINLLSLGYQCAEHVATNKATHVVIRRA